MDISNNKLKEIIADPIDDREIKHENKEIRIISYNELEKYTTIDELLPDSKEHLMLLYQTDSESSGHWTCLVRNDDSIYYFDSYGKPIDEPMKWDTNKVMKTPHLTNIIDNSDKRFKIYENTKQYQKQTFGINTCGRHAIAFIEFNKNLDFDLDSYYLAMKLLKKDLKQDYDSIVSGLINVML